MICLPLLGACSQAPRTEAGSAGEGRREFLIKDGAATVSCVEGPKRKSAAHLFYTVERVDKAGKVTRKIVRQPMRPTREVPYRGTTATREIPRAPRLNAQQVINAPPANAATLREDSAPASGGEPLNILPAFVLTAPLAVAMSPVDLARELSEEKDPIRSLEKTGVTLGISKAAALRLLKRKAAVVGDGIRVGPGWSLRDQSAWLEFQNDKLTGLYTGDFYPLER